MNTSISLRAMALAASMAAAAFGAAAQVATPAGPSGLDITRLQAVYLRCADASARYVLDSVEFAHCAAVGEALRDRAFDGSFERLIAWWHGARAPAAAEVEPATGEVAAGRTGTVSLQTMFATE